MKTEELINLIANPDLLNNKTVVELKQLTEEYPWFYLGWILYLKNLKQIDSPEFQTVLKKAAILAPDRKLLYNYLDSETQRKSEKADVENILPVYGKTGNENGNGDGNSLIDKFLQSIPGGIRIISENGNIAGKENSINVVEKSVAENDELITETLASIYFQQKNYEKAIDSYQKLSLKYPAVPCRSRRGRAP